METMPRAAEELVQVELFDPAEVRPWRFHNRRGSGMDDESLNSLASSIARDGQQQLGLARRLDPGDTHKVEAIFGVRRLDACRRAGLSWRAQVREATFTDAECASLMHGENEWTEGVSPLENAAQWMSMLDARVFANQSALAAAMGCHRGTVSRAVITARALLVEPWIERLVRPVMHQFSGRSADRLADACADEARRDAARDNARKLRPGVPADSLYRHLFGEGAAPSRRETVFVRRKGRAGGGVVAAKIERDGAGGFSVSVRAHEQTPAERAELAEQIEALVAAETAGGENVRLGRRLAGSLDAQQAKDVHRSWLEGCIWAAARASGLEWDQWRCAVAADVLRAQQDGWEAAMVKAVGEAEAAAE
ncbi:MAG: ParB N-terminal domain-containing protein [Rhodospirillales bacterium]|nr:ParB N-terminal domain-containing protein [Rhodospirillales bacterium]